MNKKIMAITLAALILLTGCKKKENTADNTQGQNTTSAIEQKLTETLGEYLEKYKTVNIDTSKFADEIQPLERVHTGFSTNYGMWNYSSSHSWNDMQNKSSMFYWRDRGYEIQYLLISVTKGDGCRAEQWSMSMFRNTEHTAKYTISGINIIKLDTYDHFDDISKNLLHAMPVDDSPNPQYAICRFNSAEDREKGQIEYAYGDIYSNGAAYPSEKTVIVNSRMISDVSFKIIDGLYWLPIEKVANAAGCTVVETNDKGTELRVPNSDSYLSHYFPSTDTDLTNSPWLLNSDCEADEFYLWDDPVQGEFKRVRNIDGTYYVEAEAISRIWGVDIQASENLVVITTDPYDIAQYFAIADDDGYGYIPDLDFIKPNVLSDDDYRVKYSKEPYYESYEQ